MHQAQGNEEYYFGNPVNSYVFIKHLTDDWNNIREILPAGKNNLVTKVFYNHHFIDFSKNLTDKWLFPSFEDYTGK
jgi:hypothetical protein